MSSDMWAENRIPRAGNRVIEWEHNDTGVNVYVEHTSDQTEPYRTRIQNPANSPFESLSIEADDLPGPFEHQRQAVDEVRQWIDTFDVSDVGEPEDAS